MKWNETTSEKTFLKTLILFSLLFTLTLDVDTAVINPSIENVQPTSNSPINDTKPY